MTTLSQSLFAWISIGFGLALCSAAPTTAQDYEYPGLIAAAQLTDSVPLMGEGYRVREHATVVSGYGRFVIESNHGVFIADGVDMLQVRIGELDAIGNLQRMRLGRVMVDSGGRRLRKPVAQVSQIAANPKQTVTGLPSGARRYLVRGAQRLGEVALDVADAARDKWSEERVPGDEQAQGPGAQQRSARLLKRLTLREIGYQRLRRGLARHLGVDPYSSNQLLSERLDELAWAAWVGDRGVSLGLGAVIAGPLDFALDIAGDAHELVWTLPPEKIRKRNAKLLRSMSLHGKPARDFLRNAAFNPLQQTAFVDLLSYLGYSAVREELLALATAASSERESRSLIETMHGLRSVAQSADGLPRIGMIGTTPVLDTGDGSLTIVMPVDYLAWTAATAELATRSDLLPHRPRLLVRGLVSARAMLELSRAGWRVEQRWQAGTTPTQT